jgi:Flp pilus assembly pilin Flp
MRTFRKLRADTAGIAAVEMGLLLSLIALSILGSLYGLRDSIGQNYDTTASKFAEANDLAG